MNDFKSIFDVIRETSKISGAPDLEEYTIYVKMNFSRIYELLADNVSHIEEPIFISENYIPFVKHVAAIEACIMNIDRIQIRRKILKEQYSTYFSKNEFHRYKFDLYKMLAQCDILISKEAVDVLLSNYTPHSLHNPHIFSNEPLQLIERIFQHILSVTSVEQYRQWTAKDVSHHLKTYFPDNKKQFYFLEKILSPASTISSISSDK